ncbi:sialidase family protein [Streptomyces johnsoniae]|uniref:Sialidase family protein n=1 Tax=Streptomyces johnsoniae TaxID=3075532 RepID=A0ABU2S2B6_9ACTN|nr:sialidase family protein [Streptomyces sp. DSM 41886]MDT0443143.1 sialidase family protein [Streptomyces sp. DSM 41886]
MRSALPPVVLLAATLLACTAEQQDRPGPTEAPSPSATLLPTPSAEPPRIPSATELPGQDVLLRFADAAHAFALLTDCRDDGACAVRAAVLADDGWQLRDTPAGATVGDGTDHTLQVAGPGSARLSQRDAEGHEESWLTTDGGATWQPAPAEPAGTAPEIPSGALLVADEQVNVLMPDTAEYKVLAEQPPLTGIDRLDLLADGTYWTRGKDRGTGEPAAAVTRDLGRTWELLPPLPTPPGHGHHAELRALVAAEDALYAFETGVLLSDVYRGTTAGSLIAVHRSADDGRTWERVWTGGGGASPRSLLGTPIAAADGSLVVYADDGIYTSRDGGATFETTRPGPPPEEPALTPGGYLLTDIGNPGHYRISADGFTWHTLILGGNRG